MNQVENITPYGTQGDSRTKSSQVRDMFDNIATAYDRMNRIMTLGIDRRWRRRTVDMVKASGALSILDLASGTGDMAIGLACDIENAKITGADLSEGMIEAGRHKIDELGLGNRVSLMVADALALPFEDNTFDAITIAFGVRNFEHLDRGYAEMLRVLRPGGKVFVLELSTPSSAVVKPFYRLYTRGIIPLIGRIISKDKRAYAYLPESIEAVPARNAMTQIMTDSGFDDAQWHSLTLGVATIYTGAKPV